MRKRRYKRDMIDYVFNLHLVMILKPVKFVTSPILYIQEVELYTLSSDSWKQVNLDDVTIDIELSSRSYVRTHIPEGTYD